MGLDRKITSFAWNEADIAGTNYDVTLGFQPKIVILHMSGASSATDAVGSDSVAQGFGFGTTSADRRGMVFASIDAQANASLLCRHSAVAILPMPTTGGADGGSLDIAAEAGWPADGIRFTIDTALGVGSGNMRVSVLALGGTDLTAMGTIQFQEPVATGAQAIAHGLGSAPKGVLFLSIGHPTAPDSGSSVQGQLMFGATDGTREFAAFIGGDDANTTMDTRSYAKSGEVIALGPDPAVTIDGRAAIASLDATNINLTWAERASTRYIFALAWAGGQFRVDNLLTATDTSNFSDTGYGFQPMAALFASCNRAESTADTPTDHSQLSIGMATSASERIAQASIDEDAVATSETATAIEYDEVYANISTADAVQGLMDLVSFDADGMTLVMDDADPAQSFVGVAAWAANPGGSTAVPVFLHHLRQQGIA